MRTISFRRSIPRILATQALGKLSERAFFGPNAPVRLREIERGPLHRTHLRLANSLCGICASDLHLLFCDIDPRVHPAALPGPDPIYLGHEVVSTVESVGAELEGWAPGERVLMSSKFIRTTCVALDRPPCRYCLDGEYALCETAPPGPGDVVGEGGGWGDGYDAHPAQVWRIPDGLSDEQAVLVEPLSCSVRAVLRRTPKPGEKVLVIGCGMIGLGVLAALDALAPDAEVHAAARYPQQVAMAEKYGATIASGDPLGYAETTTGAVAHTSPLGKINRTLKGGYDIVYDCVSNDATIQLSLRLARANGAVVLVGVHLRPVKVDLTPVVLEQVDLIGAMAHGREVVDGVPTTTFDVTAGLILDGEIDVAGFVTHRYPLEQWRDAIETAVDKRSGAIKVVFDLA